MTSDPHGYTSAQYLEAGYRAEQAGERERAAQYYHYVAEAYTDTPEGEAARGGLMRLGTQQRATDPHPAAAASFGQTNQATPAPHAATGGWPSQQPAGGAWHAEPHPAPPHAAAASGRTAAPTQTAGYSQHGPPQTIGEATRGHGPSISGHVPPQTQPVRQRIVLGDLARLKLAPHGHEGEAVPATPRPAPAADRDAATSFDGHGGDAVRLPDVVARRARELAEAEAYAPPPKYRGGQLMARLFVWIGWLVVAGSLALIAIGLFALPPDLARTGFGFGLVVIGGIATLVSGLVLVLFGQLALAVFDGSNAMREVAAFMRARQHL